jgi:hypothetical protein
VEDNNGLQYCIKSSYSYSILQDTSIYREAMSSDQETLKYLR